MTRICVNIMMVKAMVVMSFVVMLATYGIHVLLYSDTYDHHSLSQDVVLVYTEKEVCQKWSTAFPYHAVILVGYTQPSKRDDVCHYMTLRNGSLDHHDLTVKFKPYRVFIVQGDQNPTSCSKASVSIELTVSYVGILYQNSKDPIFNTRQHWGYGGNDYRAGTGQYYACDSLTPPVMSVTATVYDQSPCDNVLPPMVLGTGVYTRTHGRCLALSRDVLWALPLYFSTTRNNTRESITLSMIAQKMMRARGDFLEQHLVYSDDNQAADTSHAVMSEVANQLDLLKCDVPVGLRSCLLMLLRKFAELKYVSKSKYLEVSHWAETRVSNTYNTPQSNDHVEALYCTEHKSYISSQHDPPSVLESLPTQGHAGCFLDTNRKARDDVLLNTCKASAKRTTPWLQWSNTLLIVALNAATYVSIPMYETLYRSFFPNIVYCGASFPNNTELVLLKNFTFTFIKFDSSSAGKVDGATNYDCLIKASRLGYDVTGYLQVADDVLLMPHRLQHMDLSRAWTWRLDNIVKVDYMTSRACNNDDCWADKDTYWKHFSASTLSALAEIQQLAEDSETAADCQGNMEQLYGGTNWSLRVPSDFFYVPAHDIYDVTELLELFHRHRAHRDIAVPTVLHCIMLYALEPIYTNSHKSLAPNNTILYSPIVPEPGRPDLTMTHQLYEGGEDPPWNVMTGKPLNGITFLHPHKLTPVTNGNKTHITFFCKLFEFFSEPSVDVSRVFFTST